jgi:hypothetical protein
VRKLDELLGSGSSSRGVFTTNSESNGELALRVPTGRFALTVIPPDGSGFAWRVDPGFDVGTDDETPPEAIDLGQLRVGLPVAYRGSVLVPSAGGSWVEVPGALIRAYAFLDEDRAPESDPADAASVVQVAEARAKDDGTFALLVPSTLE